MCGRHLAAEQHLQQPHRTPACRHGDDGQHLQQSQLIDHLSEVRDYTRIYRYSPSLASFASGTTSASSWIALTSSSTASGGRRSNWTASAWVASAVWTTSARSRSCLSLSRTVSTTAAVSTASTTRSRGTRSRATTSLSSSRRTSTAWVRHCRVLLEAKKSK